MRRGIIRGILLCYPLALVPILIFLVFGCGGGGGGGSTDSTGPTAAGGQSSSPVTAGPRDLPGESAALIKADLGGTLTTANGISLQIPPNALLSDITVRMIPVKVADENIGNLLIVGVRFEPEGTTLQVPAVLRMPLPDWDGNPLEIHAGTGKDPLNSLPTGSFAKISGDKGPYVAEVEVFHFSVVALGRNCHKATIRRILDSLTDQGLAPDNIKQMIKQCYSKTDAMGNTVYEVDIDKIFGAGQNNYDGAGPKEVQAILDTFFADLGGWDANLPPELGDIPPDYKPPIIEVPSDILEKMRGLALTGKQVAFAFKSGKWGKRGAFDFLDPYADENRSAYSHTATLEFQFGWKIFNGLPTTDQRLMNYMRKERGRDAVEFRYSAEGNGLNDFRLEKNLAPLEKDLCGAEDCLNDPDNITGAWIEVPSPRVYPWNAVRIYTQVDNFMDFDFVEAKITLDSGYSKNYRSRGCDRGNVIGLFGTDYPSFLSFSASNRELFHITLGNKLKAPNNSLAAPTAYGKFGMGTQVNDAIISFWTEDIKNQTPNPAPGVPFANCVVFAADSGTIWLNYYGTELGDRIKGTFYVNIVGGQVTCPDSSCTKPDTRLIRGTAQGEFDFSLRRHRKYYQ